jgi:hypothetical protein
MQEKESSRCTVHIHVYRRSEYCPPLLDTVDLLVPARYIREVSIFNICSSRKNCPFARNQSVNSLFVGKLTCVEANMSVLY